MKAGLRAHLKSLVSQEDNKAVTGKDLNDPKRYLAFVEDCKLLHRPIPPGNHIRQPGHHWLAFRPEGFTSNEIIVAQWSPTELRWYHSGDLASMAKPISGDGFLHYWEWVAEAPLPPM